jgi:protein-arginine kinase activator protein McsA
MANAKQALEKEGWNLVSTTGGEHLRKTLEMCEELGFEVHLEEVEPEKCKGCIECFITGEETIYRVYTRTKKGQLQE